MHIFTRGSTILLLAGDFLAFTAALLITLFVRFQSIPSEEIVNLHLEPFIYLFFIWVLVFLIAGLYDLHFSLIRKSLPAKVFRVQLVNTLIAVLYFFLLPLDIAPKTILAIYLVVSTGLIVLWRLYLFPLITAGKSTSMLVIGDSEEAVTIARVLASNPFLQHIQAYHLGREGLETFSEFRESLLHFVQLKEPEIIIADMRDEFASLLVRDFYLLSFEDKNIRFYNLPSIYEQLLHRVPPSLVEDVWFLENVTSGSPHYAYDVIKRTIDIIGSLILLVLYAIVFPFVALAIKIEDAGPLFYRAERVGRYNCPIHIYKFRTMSGRDNPNQALKTQHVVTKVGNVLRKTRIDELPQVINVLKGDLSFIGPRPEIPTLAHVYAENIPYYNMRHNMKPGLSGWAQINNFDVPRGGVDVERTVEKLSFDLYYLKHRSLLLDIEIALKTINTLLMRTGT